MHTKSNNVVLLRGQLSSDPRQLPSGDEVINYEVTTETDEGKASVPVAWFAPRRRPNLQAGDEVLVAGFVRRRFFRAGVRPEVKPRWWPRWSLVRRPELQL